MASLATTIRFDSEEQKRRAMRAAALHGMSLNAFVLYRLGVDQDSATTRARAGAMAMYQRLAESPEFDELDALLAAAPRSDPEQLGFNPAAYSDADSGAA